MRVTRRRLTALVLAAGLASTAACSYHGDTSPDKVQLSATTAKAPDFDQRQPGGGPRRGPDGNPVTSVLSSTASAAQSADAATAEWQFFDLTNAERARVGVPPVGREPGLDGYARNVAATIAAAGRLAHSNIVDLLGAWWVVGENIGYGPSVAAIQAAYQASPSHHDNMVNPLFGAVGIGVWVDGAGRVWAAQDYAG